MAIDTRDRNNLKIIIVARTDKPAALWFARELRVGLQKANHTVDFEKETGEALNIPGSSLKGSDADVVIVVGGDGTILRAVHGMTRQIPILGINYGGVGFLADIEPEGAPTLILPLLEKGFDTEHRTRIVAYADGEKVGTALNEVAILSHRPARILEFDIVIDGEIVQKFKADGLLASTPTGSTAYAMSAGGPIVDPLVEGYLLVPIAPYMLGSRPQMISGDRRVEIRVASSDPFSLVIDGQLASELGTTSCIEIQISEDPALFVDSGRNFFRKVGDKLGRH